MPKKATKAAENVLYKARMEAAKWNENLSSREGTADESGLDRTRIANMELGFITPYPEEILRLSDLYHAPELCNYYCSHQCPIGKRMIEPVEMTAIEVATLQLLSSVRNLPDVTNDLVDIVEDGQIDASERSKMEHILETLNRAADKIKALELIYMKKLGMEAAGYG